jgi:hypothetical protein
MSSRPSRTRSRRGAICAYCKRIRDGQGTWHVLEEYLSEHSEALFSHGVCPACLKSASLPAGDASDPAVPPCSRE